MSGLSLGAASALRLVKGQNLAESNIVECETRTGGKSTTWIGFGKPWLDDQSGDIFGYLKPNKNGIDIEAIWLRRGHQDFVDQAGVTKHLNRCIGVAHDRIAARKKLERRAVVDCEQIKPNAADAGLEIDAQVTSTGGPEHCGWKL